MGDGILNRLRAGAVGLYRFANGRTVNADINGAANILRKSKQNFDFEGLCKGLLDSPLRIRLS
jgi:putative transposase